MNKKAVSLAALPFFAALAACQSAAQRLGWETFSSADGAFSVAMPGIPREQHTGGAHSFTSTEGYFTYAVSYQDFPAGAPAGILDALQAEIVGAGGTLVEVRDVSLDGNPGRYFRARESDDPMPRIIEARSFLAGRRVYRISVRYLISEGLSEKIGAFLDSFRLLSEGEVSRLRSVTPTAVNPDFELAFVKIHDCRGTAAKPYVALRVANTGNVIFREAVNLVTADGKNALYGQGADTGYSGAGFHRDADTCGAGEVASLKPGETAYLSLGLYTGECLPDCRAHAIVELCNEPSAKNTCAKKSVDFTVEG